MFKFTNLKKNLIKHFLPKIKKRKFTREVIYLTKIKARQASKKYRYKK